MVRDDIAHSGHLFPGNGGVLRAEILGKAFGGFVDDGDLVKDGG